MSFRKKKELEKGRQNGTVPVEHDEDGKMINPHNPEFITKRPWYLGPSGPSLKHHSLQKMDHSLSMQEVDELIQNSKRKGVISTTFRKGSCTNCGASTHSAKDCVERPRPFKRTAKSTGQTLAPDEVSVNIGDYGRVSFDGKRDRWQGYDPNEHKATVDRYSRLDNARSELIEQAKQVEAAKEVEVAAKDDSDANSRDSDCDTDYDSDEDDDNDDTNQFLRKDEEAVDFQARIARQGGVGGDQMKETVRNLRVREDTAKYLWNLDPNSAVYIPKDRSMRGNPRPDNDEASLLYSGDNFSRFTGDAVDQARAQIFAWDADARGNEVHLQALPTLAEKLAKRFTDGKQVLEANKKNALETQYGSQDGFEVKDKRMIFGQTWAQYSSNKDNNKDNVQEDATKRSKYAEDVHVNGHTSIFGSYFNTSTLQWGFACCQNCERDAICSSKSVKRKLDDDASSRKKKKEEEEEELVT